MMLLAPIFALAQREIIRYLRQKSRVIGGFAQPILIWLFFGAGFSGVFQADTPATTYTEYVFPGILMLLLLFSSVFSAMTLIEDRDHGFLQGVLASPVPRSAIVLGKVGGGAALAVVQSLLLLGLAMLTQMPFTTAGILAALPIIILSAIGFAATGFAVAWSMKSTSGFHAIMMIVLMPAWMLSGALFPVSGVPGWLAVAMSVNPLCHAHALLSNALWTGVNGTTFTLPLPQCIGFGLWILAALGISLLRARHVIRGSSIAKASAS